MARMWLCTYVLSLILCSATVRSTPVINFDDIIIGRPEPGLELGGSLGHAGSTRREPGQPVYSGLHDDDYPTERSNEERSDMVELLERYAPVFKLSKQEEWFPSSVEYMLPHYDHVRSWPVIDSKGSLIPVNISLINPFEVDHLPRAGSGLFLSIPHAHNPQPSLSDPSATYLNGPPPSFANLKRGEVDSKVYGIWVDRGRGIVDLHYWTYYPFNFGKHVGPLGWLGHHVSDWERLRVRTVNGTATAVDYNVHAGPGSVGTVRWEDVPKVDNRPVAFVAAGSHGVWSSPGYHVYADLLGLHKLVDVADDEGPIWDTKHHVVPIQWWHGPKNGSRVQHDGSLRWMNFRGRWGNMGEACWWSRRVEPICQLVDSPGGPNRDFRGAMDCAVGPAANNQSSSQFTFLLRDEMVRYARQQRVTEIKVEQICERSEHNEGDGDVEDDVDRDDDDNQFGETDGGGRYLIWAFSTHKTESVVAFNGSIPYTVSVPSCKSRKNAVASYRLTLCTPKRCLTPSHERPICTWQTGKTGYHPTRAVILDDLDEWSWDPIGPWEKMINEAMVMVNQFFMRTWLTLITII